MKFIIENILEIKLIIQALEQYQLRKENHEKMHELADKLYIFLRNNGKNEMNEKNEKIEININHYELALIIGVLHYFKCKLFNSKALYFLKSKLYTLKKDEKG